MLVSVFIKLLLVYCSCVSSTLVQEQIAISRHNESYLIGLKQCVFQDSPTCALLLLNETTFRINEIVRQSNYTDDNVIQLDITNLWRFPPTIAFNASGLSGKCQSGIRGFLRGIRNHELWALKMLDATAKIPSGILSGNVNQFGDYDECLSVQKAQYCLTEVNLEPVWTQPYLSYRNLVHSHFAFRGSYHAPQHRVPDFTSIRWGICAPSECTPEELEHAVEQNIGIPVHFRPSMCKNADEVAVPLTFGDYFARLFFAVLLLAVTTSSIAVQSKASFLTNSENILVKALLAFSLQNNWRRLTTIKDECDTKLVTSTGNKCGSGLRAVDGIRALSAIALLLCHKSIAILYNPYINRTAMVEGIGQPWSVVARTAIVYTDSFMLISGLLTTHSILRDIDKHGSFNFKDKVISRIFRITPNIVTLIIFCTYLLPNINSGPLWPIVVKHHADLCKEHMWRNFLYVHNHFGFENMCLTHTHQVGIDMQLFLFTPFLVYFWWYNKNWGVFVAGVIAAWSTALRYFITIRHNLSHVIFPGILVEQMFDTANLSYILPTHRATIYIFGVLLAYLLKTSNCTLSKIQKTLVWIVAVAFGILAVFGPFHMARIDYSYNNVHSAIFAAISPILWGLCLTWVIFASNCDSAGWFGDLLSWRGFKLFTRIGYAFYLVQFPVFFYNVGVQKSADEFTPNSILNFTEVTIILFLSILLTLCVEMPFQRLKAIFFDSRSSVVTKQGSYTTLKQSKYRAD